MNFLGIANKLTDAQKHWILYLNDPHGYQKYRGEKISVSEIVLYDKYKTLEAIHRGGYSRYSEVIELLKILENADTDR
jgi:hypothetical protein